MYIGIDVGGTNLKAGLVDEAGNIVKVERVPLDFQGPERFAEILAELSKRVIQEKAEADKNEKLKKEILGDLELYGV